MFRILRTKRIAPLCALASVVACATPRSPAPAPSGPARAPVTERAAPTSAPPGPLAPKRPVVREYGGVRVVDDYAWLEDGASDEVRAWTSAENALARRHLDALPERAAVRARVEAALAAPASDYRLIRHGGGRLFALVKRPPAPQALLVALDASGERSSERVLLDPTSIDPSGATTIDFFVPSPDGKLVAVSLSKDGTEQGDLHLFDVATGRDRGETIPRVNGGTAGGSVACNEDGSGFWYTRYPRPGERPEADLDFFQQVWFHAVGTPEAKDTYAFGKELPRIAEIELEWSDDGRAVLASVANGDGGEIEHHVRRPDGAWVRLSRFEDEVASATFGADGKICAVSRKAAPRGKVVAFEPPWTAGPAEILPEGDGVVDRVVAARGALYVVEIAGGPSRVRRVPLGVEPEPLAKAPPRPGRRGRKAPPPAPPVTIPLGARGVPSAELPLPPVSSVTGVLRTGDDLLLRVESYLEAPAWHRYKASEHRLVKTSLAKAAPPLAGVAVVRASCTSKDGTRVPMTILRREGTAAEGAAPTLLTGYGGFGVSLAPRQRPWHRVWLEQGGVVAEANLRGGGELGEAWHRAGMRANKQNVFDDFAACARALFDLGITKPERLAITGRSNGGLLMGAAMVQHPEFYRAVVSAVGLYDMLRMERSPNGAFNVTEYGSVQHPAELRALLAYSPLHNVRDGVAYPAVLFMTGENDPRVDPYHSRKMLARLRAATASSRPLLLRASGGGHGAGAPLAEAVEETTDMLAFLFHELGVPVTDRP